MCFNFSCDILTQDLSRISKGVRTGLQLFKANKTNYLTQQTNLYQSLLENINNTAPNPQQTFVSDGNAVCLTYPTMNSNLIEVDQPANFVGSLELFQDNPDSYGVSITDPVPYYGQNSTTNFTTVSPSLSINFTHLLLYLNTYWIFLVSIVSCNFRASRQSLQQRHFLLMVLT